MKVNQDGVNLIKKFESCSLHPYADAVGVPTIGYGCTRYADGKAVKLSDTPISVAQADELLRQVLLDFETAVNQAVATDIDITQNQFNALVSFTFNVGAAHFKHSTLLKKLNDGDVVGAALEFQRWRFAGGKVLKGLLRRRLAEAALFLEV